MISRAVVRVHHRGITVLLLSVVLLLPMGAARTFSARAASSDSSLVITAPPDEHSFRSTDTPAFTGQVDDPAGSSESVELVLRNIDTRKTYSATGKATKTVQKIAIATDTNGDWAWQPGFPLPAGSYTLTATAPAVTTAQVTRQFSISAASGPSFVTLLMGRTQAARDLDTACRKQPLDAPNGSRLTLEEIASRTAQLRPGATVTGTVVGSIASGLAKPCPPSARWSDLTHLTDTYGWAFVSQGKEYIKVNNPPTFPYRTAQSMYDNICGSLDEFTANGQQRAWGMFAYPDGKLNATVARDITTQCFAFGRTYSKGTNLQGVFMPPDPTLRYVRANSILGGACADATLPCSTVAVKNNQKYLSPAVLQELADVGPGQWTILQAYVFAEGSRIVPPDDPTAGLQWDCTGDGPEAWPHHWTSVPELYCWNDWAYVLNSIPATASITDPATVAQAWGVTPGSGASTTGN